MKSQEEQIGIRLQLIQNLMSLYGGTKSTKELTEYAEQLMQYILSGKVIE